MNEHMANVAKFSGLESTVTSMNILRLTKINRTGSAHIRNVMNGIEIRLTGNFKLCSRFLNLVSWKQSQKGTSPVYHVRTENIDMAIEIIGAYFK